MRDSPVTEGRADGVRLDKWLWAARFFKTRALASDAIDGGKVDVNGAKAKRARLVRAGDEVRLRQPPMEWVLEVRAVSERRGPASVAQGLYDETAASRAAREAIAARLRAGAAGAESGRPSKRDRRDIARLRGR
ncbi:MAG TPA: RNA-binding S4 domain-containing protein [Gemmatimonadaceae bacterium]|nr:RNA-binding S4 domain-containing protein [Gemmatimonadaceae bacterium]